jgi:TIR domain
MRVFISWSGAASRMVALGLHNWLPLVIQSVQAFMSEEDTDKGTRWFGEVSEQLAKTDFGIVCLTPENVKAPWVHFEAGALSKSLGRSRVAPFLIGIAPSALDGPLAPIPGDLIRQGGNRAADWGYQQGRR